MKKKVLVLVLTLVMLASVLTVPAAAVGGKTFPDAKGHWAEESIMRWSRCGLVNGDNLGNVNPDKPLRRCEMATILSNMLGLRTAAPVSTFRDINGTEWYARAILRCAAAGIMQGSSDSMSLPEDYITREEAITMFCRALNVPRDDDPDLSKFSDGDKVSGWAAPYLTTLTELGILSGMGDGSVAPHDYINRAGAFTLMDKAISVYANAPGNYPSQNANGFVVINANTYQAGDVIVSGKAVGVLVSVSTTDTVRLRDFSAENVDINGKGTVIIGGKSRLDNVEAHTEIEMTVEADATVDTLDINSEKITLTNAGTIKNLSCDKVATVTNSGKVENLVADAAMSITNTGTVDKLVANAGITVDNNKGTIRTAEINKGGVVMDGAPQQMTVATGVARPNNSGGRPVSATGGVVSSGGSSSGSGSGGGSSNTKPVTGVTLDTASWVMNAGKTKTLTATVEPSNASNKNVTWKSSNPEVATVANGVVTAVAEGEATITVTTASGSKTATCKITVRGADDDSAIPVKSVSFDQSKLELTEKDTATLKLIIDPENATVDGAAKWESSDTGVVAVDQSGKLTAVAEGKATITATVTVTTTTTVPDEGGDNPGGEQGGTGDNTDDNQGENEGNTDETENPGESGGVDTQAETTHTETYKATCEVTVKAKPAETVAVESVSLNKSELTLEKDKSETLTATVNPLNATNRDVTWKSSDASVATVDGGVVTAKAAGTATITVTTVDGEKTATCAVTVNEKSAETIAVTGVTLDQTSLTLEEGATETLTATVAPSNATDKTVTWTSDDETVATVNGGVVTAKAVGTATITVTTVDGEKTATCEVTVKEKSAETIAVTGVTLDQTSLTLEEGATETLTATVAPSNATDKTVTWSSSDEEVATVEGGTVTAVGEGTATITVTTVDGEKTATCEVTVNKPAPVTVAVTGVSLNETTLAAKVGETLEKLVATIEPENATNQNVIWESSNTAVVTVADGNVTIVGIGEATITVTTEDGGHTATCTITVSPAEGGGEETGPTEGDDDNPTGPSDPETSGTEDGEGENNETQPTTGDGGE